MDFTILSTKQDYLRMRGVVTNFARAAIETSSFFFFFFLVCLFVCFCFSFAEGSFHLWSEACKSDKLIVLVQGN